jgi:guanine deaminase
VSKFLVKARILNPISDRKCCVYDDGAMVFSEKKGEIYYCGKFKELPKKYHSLTCIDYSDRVIVPALYDLHFHWVQDDVRLMPKASLLSWLSQYTWPHEAKFKNKKFSRMKAQKFFKRLAGVGTIGGAVFSSLHEHSLEHAIEFACGDYVVGNVLMTMNSPKELTQTQKNAKTLIDKFSKKYQSSYALTPRFAPTTHPEIMAYGAKVAKKNKCFIQSHLCETQNEIEYVLGLYRKIPGFEKVKSYVEVYEKCQILGKKTLMGHGIYLSKDERKILSKTKTKIIHCPTSNAPVKERGLGSGLFNFKSCERDGIDWALGSDIGGGPFLSMFDVMRSFVMQNEKAEISGATYTKALYRTTLKSAEILEISRTSGNFAAKKFANFLVLKAPKSIGGTGHSAEKILSAIIKKCAKKRSAYDSLVEHTYYRGNKL